MHVRTSLLRQRRRTVCQRIASIQQKQRWRLVLRLWYMWSQEHSLHEPTPAVLERARLREIVYGGNAQSYYNNLVESAETNVSMRVMLTRNPKSPWMSLRKHQRLHPKFVLHRVQAVITTTSSLCEPAVPILKAKNLQWTSTRSWQIPWLVNMPARELVLRTLSTMTRTTVNAAGQ